MTAGAAPSGSSSFMAWLQLLRLPNVFTALADVLMGYFVTRGLYGIDGPVLGLLLLASVSLYLAGMVLNDVYDVEIDARERPSRPLPSGRISPSIAGRVGYGLLATGLVSALAASFASNDVRPVGVAFALAITILLYDRVLKRFWVGPLAMGTCRALNVLLGMSTAQGLWQTVHGLIAAGVGIYIAGVTWFARTEADTSRRPILATAAIIMAAGMFLLHETPRWMNKVEPLIEQEPSRWHLLWLVLGALILWRCVRAITWPTPPNVQLAVRNGVLSLIVLDGVVCYAASGVTAAMIILFLLIPANAIGRFIYST